MRLEVDEHAQSSAAEAFAQAQAEQREQQRRADSWWDALIRGESTVLTAAFRAAFDDNPARVVVSVANGSRAVLLLCLPGPSVLPQKRAHVTPGGRLSSKAWTKTEFNGVYAELIGAHLLATARETWAVAPSVTSLRIVGLRTEDEIENTQVLFDVEADRAEGDWAIDKAIAWTKRAVRVRFGAPPPPARRMGLGRSGRAGIDGVLSKASSGCPRSPLQFL